MKTARGKYLWLGLALVLLALTAVVFLRRDRLIDDLLRPRLVAMAAERLSADVAIGHLVWQHGGFTASDLTVERPDHYQLIVPRVRFELSLPRLLFRRIPVLEIFSPRLSLQVAATKKEGGLPARLPVSFGRLAVHDGRIAYGLPGRNYTAGRIEFEAVGGDPYDFKLTAFMGNAKETSLHLAGRAEWHEGLTVSLESFDWDGRELLAGPLDLLFLPGEGSTGGGRLRLTRLDREILAKLLSGFSVKAGLPDGWDFVLQGLDVQFSLADNRLFLGLQVAAGGFSHDGVNLPLEGLNLDLVGWGNDWQAKADGRLAEDNPFHLKVVYQSGEVDGRLAATLSEPDRLKTLWSAGEGPALAGGLMLDASVSGPLAGPVWTIEVKGFSTTGRRQDFLLDLASLHLRGRIGGASEGWWGKFDLLLPEGDLAVIEGDLHRVSAKLRPVSWKQLRPLLGPGLRDLLQQGDELRGELRIERTAGGSWSGFSRLAASRVQGGGTILAEPKANLGFASAEDGNWSGSLDLQGKKLTFSRLNLEGPTVNSRWRLEEGRLIFSDVVVDTRLTGAEMASANLSLNATGIWQPDSWEIELTKLSLKDLELFSSDGLAGFAGGRFQGRGKLDGGRNAPLRVNLEGVTGIGEALWGAYYADLSPLSGNLTARLEMDPATRRLELRTVRLDWPDIGLLQTAGTISPQGLNLAGRLNLINLAGPPAELLRNALGESHPLFKQAQLAGALQANASVTGKGDVWRLRGEIKPQNMALHLAESGIRLSRLSGSLPFEFTFGRQASSRTDEKRFGTLQYETLQFGPVTMASEMMRIASTPGRFSFDAPLVLQLAGGRMTVDRLEVGFDDSGFNFDGLFNVAGVDLEILSRQLDLPLMKGRIDGDLGHIRFDQGVLRSEGEARMDVFGGAVSVRNIRLDVSSLAYLQIFADIDFTDIDLYQVTQTLSFGVMNGVIDGHIHNLRLFGATPAGFEARIESRDEGKRNISVKALNNLTILSQGGISAALSRGIYRFIDFYRYRRIGIVCDLEKDVFHLHGTALPESDRYLVYGGLLPPKIDIVAPPAAISFSEMLRRLQRVERAERRQAG
jgi:translocation and assembly module TamB